MKRGNKMNSFKVLRRLQPLYCTVLAIALVLPQSLEAAETGTAQSDEAQYNLKLRDIEERVNSLKEQVFQSKARLLQLQEVVLQGAITGAKARLVHFNDMGSSFRLIRAQYALDGTPFLTEPTPVTANWQTLKKWKSSTVRFHRETTRFQCSLSTRGTDMGSLAISKLIGLSFALVTL